VVALVLHVETDVLIAVIFLRAGGVVGRLGLEPDLEGTHVPGRGNAAPSDDLADREALLDDPPDDRALPLDEAALPAWLRLLLAVGDPHVAAEVRRHRRAELEARNPLKRVGGRHVLAGVVMLPAPLELMAHRRRPATGLLTVLGRRLDG